MTEPAGNVDTADLRVRAALAGEAVPDHHDQFWQVLGSRLIAERNAPAAPTFDPLERLEQNERLERPADAPAEEEATRRAPKRKRRAERTPTDIAPAVAQLAEHAEWVREVRPKWRRRVLTMTCILALTAVLAASVWLGSSTKPVSPPLTARQVAGLIARRLAGSPFVLGRVDTVGLGTDNGRYAFVRASQGSSRYRGIDHRIDSAYDAITGAAQTWRLGKGGAMEASSDTGLAPGPPDADAASQYLHGDDLSTIIHVLYQLRTTLPRSGTRHGRKVWIFDVRLGASPASPIDGLQVIVDQRRGLPIEMNRSVGGAVVERKQFSVLRSSSEVRQDTFRLTFPSGVSPAPFDNGFNPTQLPDASRLVGYLPATPGWLPPGFELSTVAVLQGSPLGLPSTAKGDNPPSRDVVSVAYRHRLDQITVTMRRVANRTDHWQDPFRAGGDVSGRIQQLRMEGGRFLGARIELVSAPGSEPHLWGRTTDFVFTVAGDVDPSQLLRVANSLN